MRLRSCGWRSRIGAVDAARELLRSGRCGRFGDANMATLRLRDQEAASLTHGDGAEMVHAALTRPDAVQTPMFDVQKSGNIYLFIYRVRHGYDAYAWIDNIRYCTVFALGKDLGAAERVAI